jgi:tetratricopeptide (TPR) repeat protein
MSHDAPSLRFGPYVTEAILGAGGFGTVYRARNDAGELVALKVLVPFAADADMIRRFQREAKIRIDHPNVVKVLDAGITSADRHYIALELLEGQSLTELLTSAPLPPSEVIDLGRQMCAGLCAAHGAGIVHRDMKPGNVFVCGDGTVKLLDFGIARATAETTMMQLTVEGSVVGTPGYLSPEQAKADRAVDERADVWAVGVLLYQALSGTSPFLRDSSVATILAVVLEEPTPLGTRVANLPPGLADLVHRCMRKDPSERFQSATALLEALGGIDPAAGASTPAVDRHRVAASLSSDELRVVALLLAAGIHDLNALTRAVEEWGGQLIPMLGDRAIGVFGGHRWEGDETSHAIHAAVEARESVDWIAVASGRASGSGGTVSGDAVRAVEQACEAHCDGVAVDARAARSLGAGGLTLERVREGLFQVPRDTEVRRTHVPEVRRRDLPLLGRNAEVAQLGAAIGMCIDERRAVAVWVTGPPGVGKTRLGSVIVDKLAERPERPEVWTGRAESHRQDAALHLLASAIRSAAVRESSDRQAALSELCQRCIADPKWAADVAKTLSHLVGSSLDPATRIDRASDPQLLADKMRVAIADLMIARAERGPLALVLDDVQWADAGSLELLEELLLRAVDLPLLVCVSARTELADGHPDLFAGTDVVRIQPRGLVGAQVRALVEAIAQHPVSEDLIKKITDRTGGNPFFVEQIVRELSESHSLDGTVETLPIPLTVEGAVQSRLDHLPPAEKQLCKHAAVLGRTFTPAGLHALGVDNATGLLAALGRRGLIGLRRGSTGTEREYQFQSALVREVAYRMNPESAREDLHRHAAEYVARVPDADPEEVARHHELGGGRGEAARHYARAADTAGRRGDSRSVIRCVDRAMDLGAPDELRFELRIARADAMSFLGRRTEQERDLERALEIARTPVQRARALTEQAALLASQANYDRGRQVAAEAVDAARACDDPNVLGAALARQGWVLLYSGDVAGAAGAIEEAGRLEPSLVPQTAAMVAAWRAQLAAARGDLSERRRAYSDAIERYREVGDLRRRATSEGNLADTLNRIGAYDEARVALEQSLALARRVGLRVMEGYALANLGYALSMTGRIDEALAAFADGERIAVDTNQPRLTIAIRVYRARAALMTSPSDDAVRDAESAADEARRNGMTGQCVSALAMAARARLETGDPALALALSTRAMELRREIGSLEEDEGELFLTHAATLQANGRHDDAAETVREGADRLRELASHITDLDWRTRFVTDVIANRQLLEMELALVGD